MKIKEVPAHKLEALLERGGVRLKMGPFTIQLRTDLPMLADAIKYFYADFPTDGANIADFRIQVRRPGGLRRWIGPQVIFDVEGRVPFHPLPVRMAFPMMEWGLNWCIATYSHQYLIIHSAVLERNGRALLIVSPPGGGKSTLAAALANSGWRLLTDELALIRRSDACVVPLPRPVGLKNESINVIRKFAPEARLGPEVEDVERGKIAYMGANAMTVVRIDEVAKPGWILFSTYAADSTLQLEILPKSRAFLKLADSAFNYSLLGIRGFELVGKTIDSSDCYVFRYGNLDEAVDRLALLSHSD